MNSKQIEVGLVKNEWQLGPQLNEAVANGSRHKFNLLLSLLSHDARDFSQFELPHTKEDALTRLALRDAFSLSEPQPLVNTGLSLPQSEQISIALHQKDLTQVRLQTLLNNEALLSRQSVNDFDPDVVDNLSFLTQTRLKHPSADEAQGALPAHGVDHRLMEELQALKLHEHAIKLNYR